MTQTDISITPNENNLFVRTGNPFVDAGIAALCALSDCSKPEEITYADLEKQFTFLMKTLTRKAWKKPIHGIFFPNVDLVNPSVKNGPERYRSRMNDILHRVSSNKGQGNCVACGRRDGELLDKTGVPLLGSQKFVNWFPSGSVGEAFCPNCTIAVQFMLIGVEKVGWPMLLHCSDWTIQMAFARRINDRLMMMDAKKEAGLVDSEFSKLAGINAIYDAIIKIVTDEYLTEDIETGTSLRFYHFTNFGQNPEIDFYDIPSSVFHFMVELCRSDSLRDWYKIAAKGIDWKGKKKKQDVQKRKTNRLYENLTKGRSILRYFFDNGGVLGDWKLVTLYLRMVREMSDNRIQAIKEVADRLLEYCQSVGDAKSIQRLQYASSYRDFRSALLRVQQGIVKKTGNPLLTFDEYTLDLAPEGGATWNETRDLLLFRILEKGASWIAGIKEEPEEEDV